uniref:Uncharacterized protein n=1 Tax=Arundo donax TaxID=35708 RepID=A0A0A9DQ35_ARUDO
MPLLVSCTHARTAHGKENLSAVGDKSLLTMHKDPPSPLLCIEGKVAGKLSIIAPLVALRSTRFCWESSNVKFQKGS